MSKLAGDSGSKRSTLMVRQFIVVMIARDQGDRWFQGNLRYCSRFWREWRVCVAGSYGSGIFPLSFSSTFVYSWLSKTESIC